VQLDLNLLTALDALLEEGSVAGAAHRLHLSSPAMSRTLGRIRAATGDQILVRTGRTMTPTPYALAVQADVHRLVEQARGLLAPPHDLDLATLDRTFTLKFHDAVTTAAGPDLLARVRAAAPGVRLRFLAEAGTDTADLRRGEVDLEAGSTQPSAPEVHSDLIGHDRLMVALRPEPAAPAPGRPEPAAPAPAGPEPAAPAPALTVAGYAAADHVIVSRRGRLRDPIDEALAALGLRRHTIATVPTLTAALALAQATGALVAVPEHMSAAPAARYGLHLVPLPVEVPLSPLILAWHQRYDTDRAHTWLRTQVRATLQHLLHL
jgi:DNA-binding transcriptional LysR family regulator